MSKFIKHYNNKNQSIITGKTGILPLTYFNLIRLENSEELEKQVKDFESVYVVLSGNCDINVNGKLFKDVGQRKNIWAGNADSVYVTTGALVKLKANKNGTEIAVAGGYCKTEYSPFRIFPDDEEMVEVGSLDTHSRRCIYHILGHNANGRAGNLLVSELYADPGCWCGFPPHKHDEEKGEEETAFEEVYHYRFYPANGFGAQIIFQLDGSSECFKTQNRDTLLLDKGYHPTVASPGHKGYIFTILVGKYQRSLIQNFKEEYRYLFNKIPGIQGMINKFK
jgi:5-deoxy-glucuronate isomerase